MDKIQNLHDLEYFTNISLSSSLALKWSKARPKNKEVQAMAKAITDIAEYLKIKDKFDKLKKLEI